MNWEELKEKLVNSEYHYFHTENGVLLCGDCLEVMKEIPDKSIDLVIADPPYFNIMRKDWKGKKYDWDIWKEREEYIDFIRKTFGIVKNILKPTSSLYVFQDDKNVAYTQIELENIGFYLENHIVWYKRNNMPIKGWQSFRCFAPVTERILFFSKDFRTDNFRDLTPEQIKILNPIIEYLIEQKRKIKSIMNFKTDNEFNEFINEVTKTKSVVSHHCFTYSQFRFPTKEIYERLQTINDIIGKNSVFKKEYEEFKKEYQTLKKHYEESRRYFNQDKNYTDVWNILLIGGC